MIESEIQMELTLELAREASEPSAPDQARNLAALRARLGLPPLETSPATARAADGAGTTASLAIARAASTPARSVVVSTGAGVSRGVGLRRILAASTLTGVAGFLVGLLVGAPALYGEPKAAPVVEVPAPVVEMPAPVVEMQAPVVEMQAPVEPPAPVELPAPVEPPAPIELREAAALPEATERDPVPARRAPARVHAMSKVATSRSGDHEPDFLEAVRWLRRAQRAVRRGEPALALGLLDELDTRFPRELLSEERQATRVLGLCGTDQTDAARMLARHLLAQSPRSIYAERLRTSCAAPAVGGLADK